MKIHLWNCYNPFRISVDIKEDMKDKITTAVRGDMYRIADKLKITPARLYDYFVYRTLPIPLDFLLKLSGFLGISKEELERNITMYKQKLVPIKNSVKNPKFPLEINPYLTSIVAHLFFDGSVPADGKGTYYHQKNKEIMDNFVKKINYVFGEVFYFLKLDYKGVLKCRMPRIIGEICKYLYKIKSFGSFDARVPKKIFNLNKEHKKAFVLTAIIDEGSITYCGQIMFGVCNRLLCEDVKRLCNSLGLKTTKVTRKSKTSYYYFYINSKKELLEIANSMSKKYPFISLNYKGERLSHYFKTKKYPGLRTKEGGDLRKKNILKAIHKNPKSANQLSIELLIPPKSLRRHLKFLVNKGKAKSIKKGHEHIYFVPH